MNLQKNINFIKEIIDKNIDNNSELNEENILKIVNGSKKLQKVLSEIIEEIKTDDAIDYNDILDLVNNDNSFIILEIFRIYANLNNINIVNAYEEVSSVDDLKISNNVKFDDTIKLYINDIRRYKILTREEEVELFKKIESGDEEAKKEIINHNLRLVLSVSKRFLGKGLEYADLIQEGNIGLMTAIDKFDYNRGYKLSTYAICWIRQSIQRAIADKGKAIRIPSHMTESITKYKKCVEILTNELKRIPTDEEVAERFQLPLEKVKDYKNVEIETVSLSSPVGDDKEDGSELIEFIQSNDELSDVVEVVEKKALVEAVRHFLDVAYPVDTDSEALNKKNAKDRKIIEYRNGLVDGKIYTLEEVGKIFNLTRERIRQVESKEYKKKKNLAKRLNIDSFIKDNNSK